MSSSRSKVIALLKKKSRDKLLLAALMYLYKQENIVKRRKHRFWVNDLIKLRHRYGAYHHLVQEIQFDDEHFKEYFRLNREQFEDVLRNIEGDLHKIDVGRATISPRERLSITLR